MAEYLGSDQSSGLTIWRRDDGTISLEWPENKGPRFVLITERQWRGLSRLILAHNGWKGQLRQG